MVFHEYRPSVYTCHSSASIFPGAKSWGTARVGDPCCYALPRCEDLQSHGVHQGKALENSLRVRWVPWWVKDGEFMSITLG